MDEQGVVYSVIDGDSKEKYAIKRISKKDEKENKNMIEKIKILQNEKFHNINIVRYFNYFIEKEYLNIIMELCEEGNIENLIKKFEDNIIPEEVFFFFFN
jgi:serine/threonine protein kinase